MLGFASCEPLSQRQLAARFGCDPSNISVIVDRLVERELVERRPDPNDGRVKLITATHAGEELSRQCCQAHEFPALERIARHEPAFTKHAGFLAALGATLVANKRWRPYAASIAYRSLGVASSLRCPTPPSGPRA